MTTFVWTCYADDMGNQFVQTDIQELMTAVGDRDVSLERAAALFESVYMPSRNFSWRTRIEYQTDIRQLVAFLEGQRGIAPSKLSLTDLQTFLAHLDAQGLSGVTRRRKVASIKAFFSFLTTAGVCANDPAKELIPPEREYKEPRFLTTKEYRALLQACAHEARDTAIIELILQTGLRLSEVVRLTLHDLELPKNINRGSSNTGTLSISGKSGKIRMLPLNYKACRALQAWLAVRHDAAVPALFLTKFHEPIGPRAIQRLVNKYLEDADIHNTSVHSLRHTCAIHHIAKGTSLETVRDLLGHADLKTTALYISAAKEAMKREIQDNAL